jgi:hypothetical protein
LHSGGQALSTEARNFYEPRFGYDFSNVKVHTDSIAAKSAQSINALAYTSGSNIVFNNGQYSPNTDSGKRLLGHELTHVVQQGKGGDTVSKKEIQRFCTPAATCAGPISGSATEFVDDATAIQAPVVARRQRMTPRRALQSGHGGHARQLEIFLEAQAPGRLANVQGIFIDMDIPASFAAFNQPCDAWIASSLPSGTMPDGMAGATQTCVFVPFRLNQEALEFNTTRSTRIGRKSREEWQAETLASLTHETQHGIFHNTAHITPAGVTSASCSHANNVRELTELSAILSEFPIMFRAIPAGAPASHSARIALASWFQFNVLNSRQSIKGSLKKIGCNCNCPEVDAHVRNTFAFTSTSWSAAEKTALHTELNRAVWGIRWPILP